MRVSVSYLSCPVLGGLLGAAPVQAQFLLVQPSFSVGAAVPARSEADTHGTGLHLGAALKLPILPLQAGVGGGGRSGRFPGQPNIISLMRTKGAQMGLGMRTDDGA